MPGIPFHKVQKLGGRIHATWITVRVFSLAITPISLTIELQSLVLKEQKKTHEETRIVSITHRPRRTSQVCESSKRPGEGTQQASKSILSVEQDVGGWFSQDLRASVQDAMISNDAIKVMCIFDGRGSQHV
jgi:hypothetical protein